MVARARKRCLRPASADGYGLPAMLELIDALGLRIARIPQQPEAGAPEPYPLAQLGPGSYDNVLLVKKS